MLVQFRDESAQILNFSLSFKQTCELLGQHQHGSHKEEKRQKNNTDKTEKTGKADKTDRTTERMQRLFRGFASRGPPCG